MPRSAPSDRHGACAAAVEGVVAEPGDAAEVKPGAVEETKELDDPEWASAVTVDLGWEAVACFLDAVVCSVEMVVCSREAVVLSLEVVRPSLEAVVLR